MKKWGHVKHGRKKKTHEVRTKRGHLSYVKNEGT